MLLHQKKIWRAPTGSIRWPSNPSSRSTKDTSFIQCVDGQEPQIHGFWYLGLTTSTALFILQRKQGSSLSVGELVTNYLAGNGHIIQIIGQLSVNASVQFFGSAAQAWEFRLPFICNFQAPVEATGW